MVETGPGWEMREEWRSIDGHPLYDVSSLGRVRSWAVRGRLGMRAKKPAIISPHANATGHLRVGLGRSARESVHVLVALAFHGPCLGRVCRHLDGNPQNNCPENLKWGSHSENEDDKRRHGRDLRGTRHHQAKLTEADVLLIRCSTETISDIARRFGVDRKNVRLIRARKTWTHVA